jgi:hypothetical protein
VTFGTASVLLLKKMLPDIFDLSIAAAGWGSGAEECNDGLYRLRGFLRRRFFDRICQVGLISCLLVMVCVFVSDMWMRAGEWRFLLAFHRPSGAGFVLDSPVADATG